jgi:hypothetical protein
LNREDANASPAWVGRLEWSPGRLHALGVSGYVGAYNVYRVEGLAVDRRRDVSVGVADFETHLAGVRLAGEGAIVKVDLPPGLVGIFATRQAGLFAEASRSFGQHWLRTMPDSWFTAALRADVVDFDRDLRGDSVRSLTAGVNLRPIPESCLKLAYTRSEHRDRFNNRATSAAWLFGLATYF